MSSSKRELLVTIEQIVLELITSIVALDNVTVKVPNYSQNVINLIHLNNNFETFGFESISYKRITYNRKNSRHRFCLVVYLFAEIHRLHIFGGSCTIRGLYYRDTQMMRSQSYIVAAKLDVCRMLNTTPVHLGILSASKGLISGDIKLLMTNGDVLDCNSYCKATTLPTDFENVERIHTNAEMVLVVEKESVFESLLANSIFNSFGMRLILLTGKGYPDCTTRRMVHRLSVEYQLPVYILVDADPFGIEIMLVYRHGSQSMSFSSNILAAPMLRWIGLHPSEIYSVSTRAIPFTNTDNKKINDILSRNYISLGVRQELIVLKEMQLKAEIESINEFFSPNYIPTKLKRNLFL